MHRFTGYNVITARSTGQITLISVHSLSRTRRHLPTYVHIHTALPHTINTPENSRYAAVLCVGCTLAAHLAAHIINCKKQNVPLIHAKLRLPQKMWDVALGMERLMGGLVVCCLASPVYVLKCPGAGEWTPTRLGEQIVVNVTHAGTLTLLQKGKWVFTHLRRLLHVL